MAEFTSLNNAVQGRKVKLNNTGDLKSFWTKFEDIADLLCGSVNDIYELIKNGEIHNNYELYQNLELLQQQIDHFALKVEPPMSKTCNFNDDSQDLYINIFGVPTDTVRLFDFHAYRKNWILKFITAEKDFEVKALADLEEANVEIAACNALLRQMEACNTLIVDFLCTWGKILKED